VHDFKLPATEFSGAQEQESSQPSSLPHQPTSSHRVGTIPLIVTYHPAYLLRSPMEKAKAWQDLCFAVDVIQKA
jgi:uracil-DNA glycosylase